MTVTNRDVTQEGVAQGAMPNLRARIAADHDLHKLEQESILTGVVVPVQLLRPVILAITAAARYQASVCPPDSQHPTGGRL